MNPTLFRQFPTIIIAFIMVSFACSKIDQLDGVKEDRRTYSREEIKFLEAPIFREEAPINAQIGQLVGEDSIAIKDQSTLAATVAAETSFAAPITGGQVRSSGLSTFPTMRICSARITWANGGLSLTSMRPENLIVKLVPILSLDMQPVIIENVGPALVSDIVRSNQFSLDLSLVQNGTYNLLLCNDEARCQEPAFLRDKSSLANFQQVYQRNIAQEFASLGGRPRALVTNPATRSYYEKIVAGKGSSVVGGVARITIYGGQVVYPADSYVVNNRSVQHFYNESPMAVAPGLEVFTAPQVFIIYDQQRFKLFSFRLVGADQKLIDPSTKAKDGKAPIGPGVLPPAGEPDFCDEKISPLMVDFSNTSANIQLSSPLAEIFDIDGNDISDYRKAQGYPFEPGKLDNISWPDAKATMFLVFDKNANGQIDNGSEFFGDVNIDPKTGIEFANGFLDLAQYDANADGLIDIRDPIFSKLRFWNGGLVNGRPTASGNLFTLPELGVESIDLNFEGMFHKDTYGNETRYRSFMKMRTADDQRAVYHRIFDVYFKKYQEVDLELF